MFDFPLTAAAGTSTPFSLTHSTIRSNRLHLCVAWKSSFAGPPSSPAYLYHRYGVTSALHVSAWCNVLMQWSTCARATAGVLYLSSVGTRSSGYWSRQANCRTTFRQCRWWNTSTPAMYPCIAGGSASTKPCSMLRLSEEMRSGGTRTAGTVCYGCKISVRTFCSRSPLEDHTVNQLVPFLFQLDSRRPDEFGTRRKDTLPVSLFVLDGVQDRSWQ